MPGAPSVDTNKRNMSKLDSEDVSYMTLPEYMKAHVQLQLDAIVEELKSREKLINDCYEKEVRLMTESFDQLSSAVDDQIQLHEDQIKRDIIRQERLLRTVTPPPAPAAPTAPATPAASAPARTAPSRPARARPVKSQSKTSSRAPATKTRTKREQPARSRAEEPAEVAARPRRTRKKKVAYGEQTRL